MPRANNHPGLRGTVSRHPIVSVVVLGFGILAGSVGAFADGKIVLGPSDGMALDQPRVAIDVRDNAWGHHASGTCAIGSVLDSKLRVKGAGNLRVVDASVFPRIPGFFIASSIFMVAEKAADMMIDDASPL